MTTASGYRKGTHSETEKRSNNCFHGSPGWIPLPIERLEIPIPESAEARTGRNARVKSVQHFGLRQLFKNTRMKGGVGSA